MAYYIAVGFGAYAALSLTLFCCPIYKKKKYQSEIIEEALHNPSQKSLLVAHRGGCREAPENTIPAFKYAIAKGSHILEMDVHLTKDNVVVVAHDYDVLRVCGEPRKLAEMNYDEIPPLQRDIEIHFAAGMKYHNENPNIRMPTLEETFQKLPETIMHIDLKGNSPGLVEETLKLVRKYNRENITVLGAMSQKKTDQIRKLNPNTLTFCSIGSYFGVMLLYMFGLLPFFPVAFNFFSVGKRTVEMRQMSKNPPKEIKSPRLIKIAMAVMGFFDWISGPLFRHLQKRGIVVVWWVLNDPQDFKEALDKRVNGIMTDAPAVLRDYLDSRDKYLEVPHNSTPLLSAKDK